MGHRFTLHSTSTLERHSREGEKRGEERRGEERRGEERRGEERRGEERRGEERRGKERRKEDKSKLGYANDTSLVSEFSMEMRRCLTSVLNTSNTDGPASGEYNLIPRLE